VARITRSLIRRYGQWERGARYAMLAALALLAVVLVVGVVGPPDLRLSVIVGVMGLLLVMQVIALWANRDLVTPFTAAQRRYRAADFDGARAILEGERAALDGRGLTLLGNTYRQLGRLDESEAALRVALAKLPDDAYPLFGLGRTLLAQGRYADAADALRAALDAGTAATARADLGEALYRAGRTDEARAVLESVDAAACEPYRALMTRFLLHGPDGISDARVLLDAGLPYWRAAAERFAHTPYGADAASDVAAMEAGLSSHGL
jgi:tetratricopeptide (TPR) repeat protein